MRSGLLATPRPEPGHLLPALAGSVVILFALPLFLILDWNMKAWALAATALALRFIRPHQHGEWHPWRTVVVSLFGLVALAASVYMVYLLEIVKLANPMIRRREEQARDEKRKSA